MLCRFLPLPHLNFAMDGLSELHDRSDSVLVQFEISTCRKFGSRHAARREAPQNHKCYDFKRCIIRWHPEVLIRRRSGEDQILNHIYGLVANDGYNPEGGWEVSF